MWLIIIQLHALFGLNTDQEMASTLLFHTLIDRFTLPPVAVVTTFASTVDLRQDNIHQQSCRSKQTQFWKHNGVSHLSWAHVDAGGIGVTPSSGWIQTVIDGLALVSILSPSTQTLAYVCPRTSLYAYSLRGNENTNIIMTCLSETHRCTRINDACSSFINCNTGAPQE